MMDPAPDVLDQPTTTKDSTSHPANTPKRVQLNDEAAKKADKVFIPLTLKFSFPKTATNNTEDSPSFTIPELHSLFLSTICEEFPEAIRIYSNKSTKPISLPSKQNFFTKPDKYHSQLFNTYAIKHTKASPTPITQVPSHLLPTCQTFLIHRIDSTIPFSTIIQNHEVSSLMKHHKFFVSKYAWDEMVIDITSLGWILYSHPIHQSPDHIQTEITDQLRASLRKTTKIPNFFLVFSKPSIKLHTKRISTMAFTIQVQTNSFQIFYELIPTVTPMPSKNKTISFKPHNHTRHSSSRNHS